MIESIIPTDAEDAEQAAFASLASALRFAMNNHHAADPGTLARFQPRTRAGSSIFADKFERAAWAGDILRRIDGLSQTRTAILYVRYAPRSFPCACRRPCCSGHRINEDWQNAFAVIVEASVQAVAGKISHRQLRAGIVKRWSGAERINIGMLADKCGVHRNTAGEHAKLIKRWLDALLFQAETEAEQCLRTAKG